MRRPARHPLVRALLERRYAAPAALALLSLAGAVAVWLVAGTPLPRVHDEASYLLAADTYARGRLANPPHPHWEHFEVPHVISQPTYASKYQPAPGMLMAVGQRLAGHPLVGVWLGTAALTAAVTWMLLALVPAPWALVGGLLTALQFGMAGNWAQSYWGGAVPAVGAALLFGALAWMRREVSWSSGAAIAAGSLVLVFSRPFEGLIVFLFATVPLFVMKGGPRRRRIRVALGGLVAAGLVGVPAMAVYNHAVTGEALTLPYQLHTRQYGAAPLFVFQSPGEAPQYGNERIELLNRVWEQEQYEAQRTLSGWALRALERPIEAGKSLFFGPPRNMDQEPIGAYVPDVLLLPLLLLPWLWRQRIARYGLVVVGGLFVCLASATYFVAHYVSVLAPVWMYFVVQSLRIVRSRVRAGPVRSAIVPLALSLSIVLVGQSAIGQGVRLRNPVFWYVGRQQLETQFEELGSRHLVLVRYSPRWTPHSEFVYNSAEIDEQEVVWAHSLGATADSALLAYYPDRTAWYFDVAPGASELEAISR